MRVHIFSTECTYYSSVVPILCGIAPRGYVEPAVEAPTYIRQTPDRASAQKRGAPRQTAQRLTGRCAQGVGTSPTG